MPRDARFWRNVSLIAIAHIAVVIALVRSNGEAPRPNLQSIVWMNPEIAAIQAPTRKEKPAEATPPAETDDSGSNKEEQDQLPAPTSVKSDIQLPVATPTPTPTPVATPPRKQTATPVPRTSPKATPKPKPKATPKKPVARATPKPSPKTSATPSPLEKKSDDVKKEPVTPASTTPAGEKSGSTESSGAARSSEFSWYGKMLHDRFYSEWIQPTTSVAVGVKISALVRIRIEKDGRVSKFTIVRPSGNVVVDESVAAVAKRVTQVDPLPNGFSGGAFYEVNIKFELNPEQ
jgi:TonB family protein